MDWILSHLRVPIPEHAAVVDVGRAADDLAVVHDHQLGVDVHQLCDGRAEQLAVRAQRAEGQVFERVDAEALELADEGVGAAADGAVVVVEDDAEGVARGRADLALEGGEEGEHHVDAELLIVPEKISLNKCNVLPKKRKK